jgi:ABC-type nitrate/sulfonate/bicarbonate transport system permease component
MPQLVPYSIIGIVRSNAVAWKIAVTAEVFVAVDGLGFMVANYYRLLNGARLFATVLIIIIIGVISDWLIKKLKSSILKNYETVSNN